MNNEDKRFKQINRIATPIKIENTNTKDTNENKPEINEQVKQSISAIPPKKEVKKEKKTRKKIEKETLIKSLIVVFVIGIIASSLYLLIPASSKSRKIKYNDMTTVTTYPKLDNNFFESINLTEGTFIEDGNTYHAGSFTISKVNNTILINNKEITKKEYFYSNVGLIDDLLVFSAKSNDARTTELFAVDLQGNIVLNMYHIGDINGLVISDVDNSIVYNTNGITIVATNVLEDKLIPNNQINKSNPVSICNEDELFSSSIETNKPVLVHYSLMYKGNHEFYPLESIYTESLEEYKSNHNYCK